MRKSPRAIVQKSGYSAYSQAVVTEGERNTLVNQRIDKGEGQLEGFEATLSSAEVAVNRFPSIEGFTVPFLTP